MMAEDMAGRVLRECVRLVLAGYAAPEVIAKLIEAAIVSGVDPAAARKIVDDVVYPAPAPH